MTRHTYDEFGRTRPLDVIGTCATCKGPIKVRQPYRLLHRTFGGPPVGIEHEFCPPRLVVSR